MAVGAPKGNSNAKRGKEWRDAIMRELRRVGEERDGDALSYHKGLDACAQEFVKAVRAGDAWALKELGDRIDGKAHQSIDADINSVNRLIIQDSK